MRRTITRNAIDFGNLTLICLLILLGCTTQVTAQSFTNQTSLLPNPNFHSGVAIGVADMNGDGLDDIIRLSSASNLFIEYQEAPNASFSGFSYGDISNGAEWSLAIGDVDHNGYNDLIAGGAYNQIKLLKANADGTDYLESNLPNSNIFLQGSNFIDIDNDGWLDVFACHDDAESRNYRNLGSGNFVFDNSLIVTTLPSGNSGNYASLWTDYDNDGDQDMYLSKCRQGVTNPTDPRRINLLFQNDGNNNFTEVGAAAGLGLGDQSWSTDFADYDNDGDMDCFILNHYTSSLLMENNGDGTFSDVTASSGMSADDLDLFGIQGVFRDFDNDGFVDLLISGTEQRLFRNNGNGTFSRLVNPFTSNAMESFAIGDLNSDGYLDIYAGYANLFNGPSSIDDVLFMNDGGSNHFLSVLLEGTTSNQNGIGARLELHGAWGVQIREVRSGEGYGIMNSLRQHFGIGAATAITKLVVKWPSGTVDELFNPSIDQMITLVEGSTAPADQTITFPPIADKLTTDVPFTISATASSGLPVNFSIVSGPASISGNTITLAGTVGSVVVSASQAGNAQYNAAPTVNQTFQVTAGGPANYCTSLGQQPWIEWISNVNFGSIDNTSFKTPYGNFTNISTAVVLGSSLPITLTPAFSWTIFDEHWRVWIDWNQDGDFTDANEMVVEANGTSMITQTVNVPSNALVGSTRMRVSMQRNAFAGPCETFGFGEVEDYTINVIDNGPILSLSCPADLTVTTALNVSTAPASWTNPTVNSTCPTGSPSLTQTSGLASGSNFPIGLTTISYEATDDCGNLETCSFTILVIDGGAAVLNLTCPNNMTVTAAQGANAATATWTAPTATSNCTTGSVAVNQTAGATSGSSFSIGTTTISYEATDGCGNIETCSFTITILENTTPPGTYCDAKGQTPWIEWISNVNFGDIDNISFKESYGDFTNLSTNVNLGESYPIVLTHSFSWNTFDEYFRVWIDWNQDNDFDDANEMVLSEISLAPAFGTTNIMVNGMIDVPANAVAGTTRMRVAMQRGAYAGSCETFQNGEVEDYTINVINNGPVLSLTCPADLVITAESGETTALATWTAPTVNSTCPTGTTTLNQTTGAGSGSSFPIGVTTISYEATDDCGNVETCSFTVTILELTTVLTVTCPTNITVTAPQGSNAAVVNWNLPVTNSNCPAGGVNVSQNIGPASGSSFAVGSVTIGYVATDACSNTETCNFIVTVLPNNPNGPIYCAATGEQPWQEWIGNVAFGTIDNASGKNLYGDFTALSTVVEQGNTYPISLQPLFSWTQFLEHFTVWIDWNQDGDFVDPGEEVLTQISQLGTPPNLVPAVNGNITIPNTALTGSTRMRVAMQKGSYASSCGSFVFGEVEDYTIVVLEASTSILAASEDLLFFTAQKNGTTVRLNWTNNTGYKNDYFEVEKSKDGLYFESLLRTDNQTTTFAPYTYQEYDENLYDGASFYRVKVVFADGSEKWSNVEQIYTTPNLEKIKVFPNPSADYIFVQIKNVVGQSGVIQIYNSFGQLQLMQEVATFSREAIRFDVRGLQNGLYTISVKTEKGKRVSKQVVVNRGY